MKYTEEHEWLRVDGDLVVVGITAHASEQLGDVVFVELPDAGREVSKGEEIVVIESVKAASDITGMVNEDPTGAAWFFKMKVKDVKAVDAYMDEAAYNALIG